VSIQAVYTVAPVPTIPELIERIVDAGSGSTAFFEYELKEDGLFLQQNPAEFAEFVHYMASSVPPSNLTLDIGIASGGQTKFLRDYYACQKTIVVDLGQHPDAYNWPRIRKSLNSDLILEIFDDSHAPAVRDSLLPFRGEIDFAYVDGDHSYIGLRQDIFLVREILKPGAFMALHDTLAVEDCKRVYDELKASTTFDHVMDFNHRFGISLWQLREPVASTQENRTSGLGDL
jgi:hypothetical protein